MLLISLIIQASCVESCVWGTKPGVWRTGAAHAANTTSAQTTRSSVLTQHSGLGRLVISFILMGEKQLWAGDALARLSTAATPGTHQAFTIMRWVYFYEKQTFQKKSYLLLGNQKYSTNIGNLPR